MSTGLLSLPRKVKTKIYSLLLVYNGPLTHPPLAPKNASGSNQWNRARRLRRVKNLLRWSDHLRLLLSCRQTHDEAKPLFYTWNAFEASNLRSCHSTSPILAWFDFIRSLSITECHLPAGRASVVKWMHTLKDVTNYMDALEYFAVRFVGADDDNNNNTSLFRRDADSLRRIWHLQLEILDPLRTVLEAPDPPKSAPALDVDPIYLTFRWQPSSTISWGFRLTGRLKFSWGCIFDWDEGVEAALKLIREPKPWFRK